MFRQSIEREVDFRVRARAATFAKSATSVYEVPISSTGLRDGLRHAIQNGTGCDGARLAGFYRHA